ncbi:Purine permease 21 [Camellia lanceoleosa]|uniref:Purine permease 21 n=1 Tax=Camellia lanceoleosa TaxID=1840588 RepID=A0ACC0GIW8_9ERIC|nr:Purine permease 21 [Camellia lanceoleosa]
MGEAQDLQAQIHEEAKEANSPENADISHRSRVPQLRDYTWWLRMAIYTLSLLSGQSVALLWGRLYFDKGGKSKWMATLVQTAGFPVLLPFYISPTKNKPTNNDHTKPPSALTLASLYVFLGVFLVAVAMLYSIGLLNLPVSTYSLVCASQLGFNALFSYFLNSQKFTPFIVNFLVLLTISSTLIGFLCTVGASAGYALMISLTQLSYQKILKSENFGVVLDMIIYQSVVATGAILVGLFASREWKGLKEEMGEFELGKVSYIMTLVWEAISWQVFSVGAVGLIFEVSSLFSNVISTLGLAIAPVLAVFVFHDKMDGVKVTAMLLAIWGFVSYIYQHYLDDLNSKAKTRSENGNGASEVSLVERG